MSEAQLCPRCAAITKEGDLLWLLDSLLGSTDEERTGLHLARVAYTQSPLCDCRAKWRPAEGKQHAEERPPHCDWRCRVNPLPRWGPVEGPCDSRPDGEFRFLLNDQYLLPLAILAIMIARRSPEDRVHVVTYNIDTLLEELILALGHEVEIVVPTLESRHRPPSSAGMTSRVVDGNAPNARAKVRIVHPHGLVLRSGHAEKTIMTATEYEAYADRPMGVRSLSQVASFLSGTSLFCGFSFQDHAVRRVLARSEDVGKLLKAANRGPQHVALLPGPTAFSSEYPEGRHAIETLRNQWRIDALYEQRLGQLGVERLGKSSFAAQKAFLWQLVGQASFASSGGSRFSVLPSAS